MAIQYWRHRNSGEVYVVSTDKAGCVVDAAGPLPQREVTQDNLDEALGWGYDGDPELAEDIDQTQDDYLLVELDR